MTYIQRRGNGYLETVSEHKTRKEAAEALREYAFADRFAEYYLSSRPCKEWRD
jgi:hypothetical protein